jgi:hypothetical protein
MYIVVSANYVKHHCGYNAIGHEIHLSRHILMDMYDKGYISNNDIIVTVSKFRFFFYSKIFKNIILYDDFINLNIPNNEQIRICDFMASQVEQITEDKIIEFEKNTSYPIREILYKENKRNYYHLLKEFDYPNIINNTLIENKFFLIHHRFFLYPCIDYKIDNTFEMLKKIIKRLKKNYPNTNIIVYSLGDFNYDYDVKKINTLDEYASLMNHENCVALISEISGGGELAQYCHNKYIYMYGNAYEFNYIDILNNNDYLNLTNSNLHCNGSWNKKGCSNGICKRIGILDDLLDDLCNTIIIN